MKRILVTGATGFIGSYVALEMSRRGHHVTALHRRENLPVGNWEWITMSDLERNAPRFDAINTPLLFAIATAFQVRDIFQKISAIPLDSSSLQRRATAEGLFLFPPLLSLGGRRICRSTTKIPMRQLDHTAKAKSHVKEKFGKPVIPSP